MILHEVDEKTISISTFISKKFLMYRRFHFNKFCTEPVYKYGMSIDLTITGKQAKSNN